MAQSKTCPSCHRQWATNFKFCPDDGTPLLVHDAPSSRETVRPKDTEPSLPPQFDEVEDRPSSSAAPAKAQRAPAEVPRGRKHDARLLNLEPVKASPRPAPAPTKSAAPAPRSAPEPTPAPAKRRASRTDQAAETTSSPAPDQVVDRARELRTAPTILEAPAISEAMLAALGKQRADVDPSARTTPDESVTAAPKVQGRGLRKKTGSDLPAAPAAPPKPGGKRKPQFSETAWFMRAVDAVDPETGRVPTAPDAYRPDTSIPPEQRKRYSLKRSDEE